MDVFYYWKDYAADLKAHRISRFRSSRERLAELQEGYPTYIWVFKTPKDRKGQVQLLARLLWSDKPPADFNPAPGDTHIYYDPDHSDSVWFLGTDDEAAITAASNWVGKHFPAAIKSNFQGVNGQHAMRGTVSDELKRLSEKFETRQFRAAEPPQA